MGHRDRAQRKLEGAGWDNSRTQRGDKQVQRTLGRRSMRGRRISTWKDLSWSTARLWESPQEKSQGPGEGPRRVSRGLEAYTPCWLGHESAARRTEVSGAQTWEGMRRKRRMRRPAAGTRCAISAV